MILESHVKGEAFTLLLLLLPDSEDPAPEECTEAAVVLIIPDPPNVLVLV